MDFSSNQSDFVQRVVSKPEKERDDTRMTSTHCCQQLTAGLWTQLSRMTTQICNLQHSYAQNEHHRNYHIRISKFYVNLNCKECHSSRLNSCLWSPVTTCLQRLSCSSTCTVSVLLFNHHCLFDAVHPAFLQTARKFGTTWYTRSSADADNGLDAFVGQSRSKNILNPFQVKLKK